MADGFDLKVLEKNNGQIPSDDIIYVLQILAIEISRSTEKSYR